jgi:hypothetical protein
MKQAARLKFCACFLLVARISYSETLKMEAVLPSEIWVKLYQNIALLKVITIIWDVKLCDYIERYQVSVGYAALFFMVS